MSKAKALGTAVETAAVRWFQDNGFKQAERIVLHGAADRGDLRLQILPTIIAECKRAQRGVQLTPWMRELAVEITNANAELGLLVAKQRGAGDRRVNRWVTAMWWKHFEPLFMRHVVNQSPRTTIDIPEDWFTVEQWSPTKINSEYIPILRREAGPFFPRVPFAITYTPGNREQIMVVGPLEQFVDLLRYSGYGD